MTPRNMEDPTNDIWRFLVGAIVPHNRRMECANSLLPKHYQASAEVALVPKQALAEVIQQVGFTGKPVAILITQEPDNFGLKGYHRQNVHCTISAMADSANRVNTMVDRCLVQLGFGEQVQQIIVGDKVDMYTSMKRVRIKMPTHFGWPDKTMKNQYSHEQT